MGTGTGAELSSTAMNPVEWEQVLSAALAGLREAGLYRKRRSVRPLDATHVEWEGRRYVNFASNDYLGLTHHPEVLAAVQSCVRREGLGSGASALITGYGPEHAAAEERIAQWKGTEAAVLLPSGYQANHAAVQTLAAAFRSGAASSALPPLDREDGGGDGTPREASGRAVRFLLDKLCHASLVDAVRASGVPFRVFPHNHLPKIRRLLAEAGPGEFQVVVTESIFSMDGDAADLDGLAELKREHPFALLLDEAHASGVYGPQGSGLAAEMSLQRSVDITVVTLSKALGCVGGAVCGSRTFCDALVNFARPYIYSTSLPAAIASASTAAIAVMQREPQRQRRLRDIALAVRSRLAELGWTIPRGDSPIMPIMLGAEQSALEAAANLMNKGLFVLAIRPPTVPRGTSRLRITLSSEHTDKELSHLIGAMRELKDRPNA